MTSTAAPDRTAAAPNLAALLDDWQTSEPWIRAGKRLCIALCAVMVLFSLVSISGAVVATGTVSVESNYKTIQHLDGGIVSKIFVKNGDRVKAGDVLIRLDDTQVRTQLSIAKSRQIDFLVQQARLDSERDGKTKIDMPAGLAALGDELMIQRTIEVQTALFNARRTTRAGEQSVLQQRLEQLLSEMAGLELQYQARQREQELNRRELAAVMPLFERGFVNQQRLGPLQRDQARLDGEIGRLKGDLARARSAVTEAELKLAQADKEFQTQVADDHRKVQAQLAEITEQRTALEDKLERIDIRAPRAGHVNALAVTTEGGVITPASAILQVIPEDEKLIVEVRLNPQDVDKVRGGQPAAVRFPSLNARTTPRLEGYVTVVSPAQINDPQQQGRPYFTAQVELAPAELARVRKDQRLIPGMPAEVYIETVSRSILSYVLKPLTDMVAHAFREA
jgi:HlyD family secretion protein